MAAKSGALNGAMSRHPATNWPIAQPLIGATIPPNHDTMKFLEALSHLKADLAFARLQHPKAAVITTPEKLDAVIAQAESDQKEISRLRTALTDGSAWRFGTPDVADGRMERLWAACKSDKGVISCRPLSYGKRYVMPLSDDCDEAPASAEPVQGGDGDFYWTGWFYESKCPHCDTHFTWDGWKVIAWLRPPAFAQALAQPPIDGKDGT